MVYPSQLTNGLINFPHSAYRWVLLDGVEYTEDNLCAVYEHNVVEAWCVLEKSNKTDEVNIHIISKDEIPKYVDTDMECLINLLKKSIDNVNHFVIKNKKCGGVSDAYKLIS
jgi:hypothetical protein